MGDEFKSERNSLIQNLLGQSYENMRQRLDRTSRTSVICFRTRSVAPANASSTAFLPFLRFEDM